MVRLNWFNPLPSSNSRGTEGERRAEAYLAQYGLELVERNYRCRFGEIDLICRDGNALVFVEVRVRKNRDFGGAAESLTGRKQRRILAAARHYLAGKQPLPPCRFDAVLLSGPDMAEIEWIKCAFTE